MTSILVVDDHQPFREALVSFLNGFEDIRVMGVAEDAETALPLIDQLHPEVVLMDVLLPGMSGFDASRRIRPTAGTRVITMSFGSSRQMVEESHRSGAAAYLAKETAAEGLIALVKTVVAS